MKFSAKLPGLERECPVNILSDGIRTRITLERVFTSQKAEQAANAAGELLGIVIDRPEYRFGDRFMMITGFMWLTDKTHRLVSIEVNLL